MLRTHWLETRELKRQERQDRLARGEEEEASDEEEPKEDLVERIPGKRGRPRRKRRRRRRRVDIDLSENKDEVNLFAQSFFAKETPRLEVLAESQNLGIPPLGSKVCSPP